MTGKELIFYILQNDLEDKDIYKDGKLLGFPTIEEVAAKLNVGVETVNAMMILYNVEYISLGAQRFIPMTEFKKLNKKGD